MAPQLSMSWVKPGSSHSLPASTTLQRNQGFGSGSRVRSSSAVSRR